MQKTNIFKFFFRITKSINKWNFTAFAIGIAANLVAGFKGYSFKLFLDGLTSGNLEVAMTNFWILAAVLLTYPVLSILYEVFSIYTYNRSVYLIMDYTTKYIKDHNQNYFNNAIAGKLSNDIVSLRDVAHITYLFLEKAVAPILRIILQFALIFYINTTIGIVYIIYFIFLNYKVQNILKNQWLKLEAKKARSRSKFFGQLADYIANFHIVRSFNLHKLEIKKLLKSQAVFARLIHKKDLGTYKINTFVYFSDLTMRCLTLSFSIYLYLNNIITIGDIAFFLVFTLHLEIVTNYIVSFAREYYKVSGSVINGIESIFVPQEDKDQAGVLDLKTQHPKIEFKNLKYYYDGKLALKNLNLTINPGEKVGIVGESGAGKTTLFNLLMANIVPDAKQLYFAGHDVTTLSKSSVRKTMSLVPQDTYIFNESFKQNISLYQAVSSKKLSNAIEKAHLKPVLKNLKNGLNTVLGERGVKLSGGQRQRIGIARAILENAPILLLDEATASLDSKSEQHIQSALQELIQGKTVIAIAHRLSTLSIMDRIIVMKAGRIVEDGTHADLLKRKGEYYKLWQNQAGEFSG